MTKTLFKLRIFGIAFFLLFIISSMFGFSTSQVFYFQQIQQIFIFVSFVIFAILILLQVYSFYIKTFPKEEEADA